MVLEEKTLRKLLHAWGADMVGVGDISKIDENEPLPEELKHFTQAISIAIRLHPTSNMSGKFDNGDDHQRMIDYMEENEDVVKKLNYIIKKVGKEIKKSGFNYLAIPPIHSVDDNRFISTLYPLFPHRTAATLAGLGWIGKNGMLINGAYGPNLVWATILTNTRFNASRPQLLSLCYGCKLCEMACPVNAIKGVNWSRAMGNNQIIDFETCETYMTLNEERFGRPVCGICFLACPIGAKTTRQKRSG